MGLGNLGGESLELQTRNTADLTLTSSSDSDLDLGDERVHLLRDESDDGDEVDAVGSKVKVKKRGNNKDYGARNGKDDDDG